MKERKGFTLIELLAVIVILGLLMAIAIPSVTKYITQSRKKTITTTISNYIGALTNQVNDMEYVFTESNTVYAVPIECIALERGGTDPFGEWMQASNSYWAYVLVQYDDATSSYTYGFTFKDSAGYGLYPTTIEKLNESGSQINTDLDLTRPTNGTITNITAKANWTGFDLEDDTNLVVLEAESEGTPGDGKSTCTLCQKGSNYDAVEEEKQISKEEEEEKYFNETVAYAIYSEDDKTLTFVRSKNEIKAGDVYEEIDVTNVYTGFESNSYSESSTPWYSIRENIVNVVIKDKIKPISTANWFNGFTNCSYLDVTNLDTSNVTKMNYTFGFVGRKVSTIELVGLDTWDTSKVTNMYSMFICFGDSATTVKMGNLSNWNTSNVTNMSAMFAHAFSNVTSLNLDLSGLDTSNVTNMNSMFMNTGKGAKTWSIGDLSGWDTSNVTDMASMFRHAGQNATVFNIGNIGKWNTSKVTTMSSMFYSETNATTWSIGDLSGWDTSNVTSMYAMFRNAGKNATTFNLGDLSEWDTSNVTSMVQMFDTAGYNATTFNLGDLSEWDTSNVTSMDKMFDRAGREATTFNIGDLSKWDTSNVTNMYRMFAFAGVNATWFLDCSGWDVSKVTSYYGFNSGVTSKVVLPTWVK